MPENPHPYQDLIVTTVGRAAMWLEVADEWRRHEPRSLVVEVFSSDPEGQAAAYQYAERCGVGRRRRNSFGQQYHWLAGVNLACPGESVVQAMHAGMVVVKVCASLRDDIQYCLLHGGALKHVRDDTFDEAA